MDRNVAQNLVVSLSGNGLVFFAKIWSSHYWEMNRNIAKQMVVSLLGNGSMDCENSGRLTNGKWIEGRLTRLKWLEVLRKCGRLTIGKWIDILWKLWSSRTLEYSGLFLMFALGDVWLFFFCFVKCFIFGRICIFHACFMFGCVFMNHEAYCFCLHFVLTPQRFSSFMFVSYESWDVFFFLCWHYIEVLFFHAWLSWPSMMYIFLSSFTMAYESWAVLFFFCVDTIEVLFFHAWLSLTKHDVPLSIFVYHGLSNLETYCFFFLCWHYTGALFSCLA